MRSSRKLVVLAIFVVATAGFAQQTPHDYVQSLWQSTKTPGVSAAVAVGGKVVYSEGFGYADLENLVPANGATVYDIGSVSKVLTATAVMQLVEAGKIALDDPVTKFVSGLPTQDAPITVRHILTHTSGIRHYRNTDFPGTEDNENQKKYASFDDTIAIFRNDPLLFKPGQYYFYSSYAVNLLQGVIEKASGMPFEDYMRANVWSRAGMTSASFDVAERIIPHRARGYYILKGVTRNQPFADLSYKFASGGMMASVEDLARFGAALNHDLLMTAASRKQMWTPARVVKRFRENGPPDDLEFEQGLIWRIFKDANGRTFVNHCGTVQGFNACIVDYPAEDVVAVIAGNGYPVNPARREAIALAAYFLH